MTNAVDLDGYFRRLGFAGEARPDLATLAALHALHPAAIAFEGIDPLVGRPVRLDLDSLQAKLVFGRRGGYCFEHNALFRAVLEAIGFSVTGLAGRVAWGGDGPPVGARSHMLLLVELPEGPFIADVGFGAHLLDAPLRFATDIEQRTPHALYRITREGAEFALAARHGDRWRRAYVFDLTAQLSADYEMANWYTSTNPESLFTKVLIAERLTPEVRRNLVNCWLTERWRDGRVDERSLASAADLGQVLDQLFDIASPEPLARLFARIAPVAAEAV
ncbi:MAG TPA: arylamine N-acetyltransferase [Caulobacteraceae bacterium]|nr:arylamine N-acetyltransferase [Caulobacteraceae bacterium]